MAPVPPSELLPVDNADSDPRRALLTSTPRPPWTARLSSRLFPAGLRSEAKKTWALAWPAILCSIFTICPGPVAVLFTGHLGKTALDAVSLANSMIGVSGIYVCLGLGAACDTLFSQAYGSGRLKMMGVYLQRSLLIALLVYGAVCALHLNVEPLFLLLRQNPAVSRVAAEYMTYFLPGLLFNFWFQLVVRFLHNQDRILPTVAVVVLGNIVNALLHYLLMFVFLCGTRGSAVALALSWMFMAGAVSVYTKYSGLLNDTWPGWSWRCLDRWGEFALLVAAGVVQVSAETDAFEAGIFINGAVGVVAQGAISISLQVDFLLFTIILGYGIACSIRVGHCLGAGDADGAKTAYRVALLLGGLTEVVLTTTFLSVKNVIGRAFTDNQEVVSLVAQTVDVIAVTRAFDVVIAVSAGALRGCGLQWVGGWMNFTGYIVIAIPVSIGLTFYTSLRALGFWVGMICGLFPIAVAYLIILGRLNWRRLADKVTTGRENLAENVDKQTDDQKWETTSDLEHEAESKVSPLKIRLLIKRTAACAVSAGILTCGIVVRVFYVSQRLW